MPLLNVALPDPDGSYKPGRPSRRSYQPGAPSVEQLLVLADRAERGPLTAAEASRLREGIGLLAAKSTAAVRLAGEWESSDPGGLVRRYVAAHRLRTALSSAVRPANGSGVPECHPTAFGAPGGAEAVGKGHLRAPTPRVSAETPSDGPRGGSLRPRNPQRPREGP